MFLLANKAKEYQMRMQPIAFYKINDFNVEKNLDYFAGKTIHAVAGIGNPERFFNLLRSLNISVIEHSFPDHYFYKESDLNFGDDAIIIMTEKDAVKCENFTINNLWWIKVEAQINKDFFDAVLNKIKLKINKGAEARQSHEINLTGKHF